MNSCLNMIEIRKRGAGLKESKIKSGASKARNEFEVEAILDALYGVHHLILDRKPHIKEYQKKG